MNPVSVLFIGGPNDGERIIVDGDTLDSVICIYERRPIKFDCAELLMDDKSVIHYKINKVGINFIGIHESLTTEGAFNRIIKRYPKKRKKNLYPDWHPKPPKLNH